jgi:phenylacetate-CoA ligase
MLASARARESQMSATRVSGAADPPSGRTVVDYWQSGRAWWDVAIDSHASPLTVAAQAAARTQALIRFARTHSPFYRRLYGPVREQSARTSLSELPPVGKPQLMASFDDWLTDPAVSQAGVAAFLADPRRVGEAFLGRYAVWTSSGTSGHTGIFVHDARALAVYDALDAVRFRRLDSPLALASALLGGERFAMVAATGGHFAGNAAVARVRMMSGALAARVRIFSILDPIEQLLAALNEYRPTLLATYPSCALLLARETERAKLRVRLRELWTGGESLRAAEKEALARTFQCPVRDDYGASEFPLIAFDCPRGAMHLNTDWAVLEPVDRQFRPVPAGERSHTVLLTNLANFVQPVIRYDLGDSIVVLAERCACGSHFPAIRVEGRRDDILALPREDGSEVALLPLALETVLEEEGRASQFQIVQTGPASLCLRMGTPREDAASWQRAEAALRRYISVQGIGPVAITRDRRAPAMDARSGKLRRVIALC